jgi:hypothetical protein
VGSITQCRAAPASVGQQFVQAQHVPVGIGEPRGLLRPQDAYVLDSASVTGLKVSDTVQASARFDDWVSQMGGSPH